MLPWGQVGVAWGFCRSRPAGVPCGGADRHFHGGEGLPVEQGGLAPAAIQLTQRPS